MNEQFPKIFENASSPMTQLFQLARVPVFSKRPNMKCNSITANSQQPAPGCTALLQNRSSLYQDCINSETSLGST